MSAAHCTMKCTMEEGKMRAQDVNVGTTMTLKEGALVIKYTHYGTSLAIGIHQRRVNKGS